MKRYILNIRIRLLYVLQTEEKGKSIMSTGDIYNVASLCKEQAVNASM